MDFTNPLKMLGAATDVAKTLLTAETQVEKAKLQLEMADILGALANATVALQEAQKELRHRDEAVAELKAALNDRSALIEHESGHRWLDSGDGVKRGYPICPSCFHAGRHVQMLQEGGHHTAACPACREKFTPVDCFLEPANGTQLTVREEKAAAQQAQWDRDTAMIRSAGRRVP